MKKISKPYKNFNEPFLKYFRQIIKTDLQNVRYKILDTKLLKYINIYWHNIIHI